MKKLINSPERVVSEMLEGLAALDPTLRKVPGFNVLVRVDAEEAKADRVALISGGGGGHEPAHAGYVGRGMLSAAVAGGVFASPSPDAVLAAIEATTGPKGALLIVKNYTGDRLNFGLAAEEAQARDLGAEIVAVADDVALADSKTKAGRRGIAGTVLAHKIAGASAEEGKSLAEVADEAKRAADDVRTMGVALTPCTVPGASRAAFALEDDEIELGLGIHGEAGALKTRLESADAVVDRLLDAILGDLRLPRERRVVLLVNNLGGATGLELAIVARASIARLEREKIAIERAYAGSFLTALEMSGVSLSILPVDDRRLSLLDAPTTASAWPNAAASRKKPRSIPIEPESASAFEESPESRLPQTPFGARFQSLLKPVVAGSLERTDRFDELDRRSGDGDFGTSLARGLKAIAERSASWNADDPSSAFRALGSTLRRALGGTSGPLLGVFFLRASVALRDRNPGDPLAWADAFDAGASAVRELGGASEGDRTMVDALAPAARAFRDACDRTGSAQKALEAAAAAATEGARATAEMSPRLGRASYLGDRALGSEDPGASAVAFVLKTLSDELNQAV